MEKRCPSAIVIGRVSQDRIDKGMCPVCRKPKVQWDKRRQRSRCCSHECNKKLLNDLNGLTYGWPHMRGKIINRDGKRCKKCGKVEEKHENLVVDHIVPIAIGGEEYDPDNLQTLCKECNAIKTAEDLKTISRIRGIEREDERIIEIRKLYMTLEQF